MVVFLKDWPQPQSVTSDFGKLMCEREVLGPKINCGVGLVNCFLLVPLACLGSMAKGSRAGTSGKL